MGPTGSTILRYVLIERFGRVRDAMDVLPCEIRGQVLLAKVCVRQGGGIVVEDFVTVQDLVVYVCV